MIAVQSLFCVMVDPPLLSMKWAWGLPLIVLTVVIHVLGLGLMRREAVGVFERTTQYHHKVAVFAAVLGGMTLLATVLHGVRGDYLGDGLPCSQCVAGCRVCRHLLSKRNNKLRPHSPTSGESLASHGGFGILEWMAVVRPDRRFSIRGY